MIIKNLRLQNIRSYKDATVDLPPGRTLFEGDIGSGKSTLLMAIEFALFGLGSERGASLLRSGEQKGTVSLVFKVEGKEYSVERNLARKAGKVQQADGELTTPEGRESLSPKDMKERMLKLLGFEEPLDPKAQSVIYRYAVYTPQERMKEILSMDPDLRLQTLRKAFGIEDYKIAKENALELSKGIESRAKGLAMTVVDLPSLIEGIQEQKLNLEAKRKEAATATAAIEKKQKLKAVLDDEMDTLRENEKELTAAREKLSLLERFFRSNSAELASLVKEIEGGEKKVAKLRSQVETGEGVEDPTTKTEDQLTDDVRELEAHVRELAKLKDRTDAKIDEYRSIRETGSCPTCDREADPAEFVEKERNKVSEKAEQERILEGHELALAKPKELLESKRKYDSMVGSLNEHRESLAEAEGELNERKAKEKRARAEYEETDDKLFKARKGIEQLGGVSDRIGRIASEIDSTDRELQRLRSIVDRAERDIENIDQTIQRDERQVRTKEQAKKKASSLREYSVWIEDYFVQSLDAIERQRLTSMNQDFNAHFQEWFSTLVEDQSKEARVDENFTPLVEQDGYEQDVDYLSGGEKTSVALAYRLALNGIVRMVSPGMKSNLLILDEPTDGFSKEQLGKMREILDEIESPQVIIVSHDKELESFADQTYRVVKDHGESKVLVSNQS
ncbi:MAG: SMC family ATPase [Nitrososphaerales archaeon]